MAFGDVLGSASALTIEEQTSDDPISIRLVSRALPYRPVTFRGTMRAEFTWYPGSPEATVQVLGASEEETTLHGVWKDKYIRTKGDELVVIDGSNLLDGAYPATINGDPAGSVVELAKKVDLVRKRGQLVEVTWDGISRQGIMTSFAQTWLRREDLEWEITFKWINQAVPSGPSVFSLELDAVDIKASWSDLLNDLTSAIQAPFATLQEFTDAVNSGLNAVQQGVNAITDATNAVVGTVIDAVLTPIVAAQRMLSIIQQVQQAASDLIDTVESFPDIVKAAVEALADQASSTFGSASTTPATSGALPSVGVGSAPATGAQVGGDAPALAARPSPVRLNSGASVATVATPLGTSPQLLQLQRVPATIAIKAALYARNILSVARQMRATAARQQVMLLQRVQPELLAYFVAPASTDLRDVSLRYFGTQNEWKRLMLFNGLATSLVPRGTFVLVPRLRQGA